MKKIQIYIWLLLLLTLSSCHEENWFIHTIEYNDKVDDPEMVVTAQLVAGKEPVVYVSESVFFLDPEHNEIDSVQYFYERTDSYIYYMTSHLRREFLRDAKVLMSVNGQEPVSLVGETRMDTMELGKYDTNLMISKNYAYSSPRILQPGDKVEISVSHPKYKKTATVVQQVPYPVNFEMQVEDPNFPKDHTFLIPVMLRLSPYEGNPDDLLNIRATIYCTQTDSVHQRRYNYLTKEYYYLDTVYHVRSFHNTLYSQDRSFDKYEKTNKQLSRGYYGASYYGLYRDVHSAGVNLPIEVGGYYNDYTYEEGENYSHSYSCVDSIQVTVQALTRDEYLYQVAMMMAGYHYTGYVPDYWGSSTGDNFIEDIQDIFDEMGSMEGIQLYSNVENAIGHVTAVASTTQTFYPSKDYLKH